MERLDIATKGNAERAVAGRADATVGAGLVIGVSTYSDGKLTNVPAAARTAEAFARELAPCLTNGVTTVIDPKETYQLFLAIQKTIEKARGGAFVLYFAGLTIRRDDELLLTTTGSSLDAKSACIGWSDIDSMLEDQKIPNALVIVNAEGFAGIGWRGPKGPNVVGMGSIRIHDPLTADPRIATYGDALVDAMRAPARELRAHLSEGKLDVAALGRYLSARAPVPPGRDPSRPKRGEPAYHETFGKPGPSPIVLRDLREQIARAPAEAKGASATGREGATKAGTNPLRTILLIVAALVVLGLIVFFATRR